MDWGLFDLHGLFFREFLRCDQKLEQPLLTFFRFIEVLDRIIFPRVIRDGSEEGDFPLVEFGHGLAEIILGSRSDSVHAIAEINHVQIHFHDLILGQIFFDLTGVEELCQLPVIRLFLTQVHIAGELLGDGAASLLDMGENKVFHHCPKDRTGIESNMFVKILIFTRDDDILRKVRYVLILRVKPEWAVDLGKHPTVLILHQGRAVYVHMLLIYL